ncbi:hypothetical protein [Curtobacterium sp. SORGH_AS_0776]|uniref:hypothetical protein n=1 Tax=Curtobacterium sp. SORGH_AS_0776 TaxID=3041798 RepID=UPI00285A7CB2|nr:hypothetical protein [Curtobacterium sp. SORGH_AS_0776]MDR6172663.1 hypothetical protein [Curtobacterium sp. SORGH_AS_0776]
MTQKLIRNTDTGIVWSISPAILGWVTGTQTQHMSTAGYTVTSVNDAVCRTVLKHNGWDPDVLPLTQGSVWTRFYPASDIPLTVQGASEDFITNRMLQVQNRDDQNANALNLQVLNAKNEILAAIG